MFSLLNYNRYKKELEKNPKLQMLYLYKAKYGEEPKNIDEMILGCKAIELMNEKAKQKGGG